MLSTKFSHHFVVTLFTLFYHYFMIIIFYNMLNSHSLLSLSHILLFYRFCACVWGVCVWGVGGEGGYA